MRIVGLIISEYYRFVPGPSNILKLVKTQPTAPHTYIRDYLKTSYLKELDVLDTIFQCILS